MHNHKNKSNYAECKCYRELKWTESWPTIELGKYVGHQGALTLYSWHNYLECIIQFDICCLSFFLPFFSIQQYLHMVLYTVMLCLWQGFIVFCKILFPTNFNCWTFSWNYQWTPYTIHCLDFFFSSELLINQHLITK